MNGPGRHIWLTVEGQPTKTWARGRFRLVTLTPASDGWMIETLRPGDVWRTMHWPGKAELIRFDSDEDAAVFAEAAGKAIND